MSRNKDPLGLSPVEVRTRELWASGHPYNAPFPGVEAVWDRLQQAAHHLASSRSSYLGFDHIETMAVMGTGNEELMKHHVSICISNNWVKV